MTEDEIRALVLAVLCEIAPEAREVEIEPGLNFRDQIEFDSLDFVNFMTALDERLGRKTPELDYPKFSTLTGCVTQLAAALRSADHS